MSKNKKDVPFVEGENTVGRFVVRVHSCVFDSTPFVDAEYFEVLVSEVIQRPVFHRCYVHLFNDERFKLMGHLGTFRQIMLPQVLTEHNAYVYRQSQSQPTWKLSRESLLDLIEICKRAKPMRFTLGSSDD